MSFFSSEIVREEIEEIGKMQTDLLKIIPRLEYLEGQELVDYFETMISLVEKQKIFYARLNFSEDPEAIEIKHRMSDTAKLLGMPSGNVQGLFDSYLEYLHDMKQKAESGNL